MIAHDLLLAFGWKARLICWPNGKRVMVYSHDFWPCAFAIEMQPATPCEVVQVDFRRRRRVS